jgi:hypothetical protein
MLLAGALTSVEAILPVYSDILPRGAFALLTLVAVVGGMLARLIAQKNLSMETDDASPTP